MLKIIAILVAVAVVSVLLLAAMKPGNFRVQRSARIALPRRT